jgi:hypothetical protein
MVIMPATERVRIAVTREIGIETLPVSPPAPDH